MLVFWSCFPWLDCLHSSCLRTGCGRDAVQAATPLPVSSQVSLQCTYPVCDDDHGFLEPSLTGDTGRQKCLGIPSREHLLMFPCLRRSVLRCESHLGLCQSLSPFPHSMPLDIIPVPSQAYFLIFLRAPIRYSYYMVFLARILLWGTVLARFVNLTQPGVTREESLKSSTEELPRSDESVGIPTVFPVNAAETQPTAGSTILWAGGSGL